MDWTMVQIIGFLAVILIVTVAIGVGLLLLLLKVVCTLLDWYDGRVTRAVRQLEEQMLGAIKLALSDALKALRIVGIYYSNKKGEDGMRLKFPKHFWKGWTSSVAAERRAQAIITLMTGVIQEGEHERTIAAELVAVFLRQAAKTPRMVISVEARLIKLITRSGKFAITLDEFEC